MNSRFSPPRASIPAAAPPGSRVKAVLREAGLSHPQRIPTLTQPPPRLLDFDSSQPSHDHEARSFLVQQRIRDPNYRNPRDQTTRNLFKSKKKIDEECNTDNWIFMKYEVAKAFDDLLSRTPLPAVGVAQALLSHVYVTSLDELWRHFHDPKLEKKMEATSKKSRASLMAATKSTLTLEATPSTLFSTSTVPFEIPWLDEVCRRVDVPYIRLMCQIGMGQDALNRAFKIALSAQSINAMEALLSFGAVATGCRDAIRERVKLNDLPLVKLLLSAPKAMDAHTWQYCIEPEVELRRDRPPTLLLMCVSHRPEVVCRNLLDKAIASRNLQATAIILAYDGITGKDLVTIYSDVTQVACQSIFYIGDDNLRHKFYAVLVEAGFVADNMDTRQELMRDVQISPPHLPLIKLLVEVGVYVDVEPNNALFWAVSRMDLAVLELFKNANFASSVSLALRHVPESTTESDMLRLIDIFGRRGMSGEPLNLNLLRAVRNKQIRLVDVLLNYGASVEFEQASAIQTALRNVDFNMLNVLLRSKCSPMILSATVPTAMSLVPRSIRLQAMKAIIKKGVQAQALGGPLQRLMSEAGDFDSELIQLLIQHKAPVDGVGENDAVLIAARRGDVSILRMLCNNGPRKETLSKAVLAAFGAIDTHGYDVALEMIKLLLQKGAAGRPIDQTLLNAAQKYRLEIVRVLVNYRADANFENGAPFGVALMATNFELLGILCSSSPPNQKTIESWFYTATDPRYYNLKALELFLKSTPPASRVLNSLWSNDKFKGNPNIISILPCLLKYGLDVNLKKGVLLSFAIHQTNVILLNRILAAGPNIASLTAAFQNAVNAQSRSFTLEATRLLLEKANSAEIGQSEALLQQAHAASAGDFEGLRLLLRHKAKAAALPFSTACLATASSTMSLEEKQDIWKSLFIARGPAPLEELSTLLATSIKALPEYEHFPSLLLACGADVKFETLQAAMVKSSPTLFDKLVSSIKSGDTVLKMFKLVQKTTMTADRKYWLYENLLRKGVPSDTASEALLDSLKVDSLGDLRFPKLFLEHGASTSYRKGEAYSLALRANSLVAVRLLIQNIDDNDHRAATIAFDVVRNTPLLKSDVRMEIYRPLLHWNIDKSSLYLALAVNFKGGRSEDLDFLKLLLAKGADPNKDSGKYFALTCKAGAEPEFRALCKYGKRKTVLKVLMNNLSRESDIIRWFNICLEEKPSSNKIDQDDLLFQCMRKFPTGTTLLRLLLDKGVSASAKIDHPLCANWKAESCTALIWALFAKPRIDNSVILLLLERGRKPLPGYSTPLTKVSAVFSCLLDSSRTPILKVLLERYGDEVSDYMVPGSSFGPLSVYPKPFQKEDNPFNDELSLSAACLYLGNFEAFKLLRAEETPNDGMLHNAALLALPKFVRYLLEFHNPEHKSEDFGNMVPLAVVCESQHQDWCRIANEEGDLKDRQIETIKILAPKTNPILGHRNMTILHYSMEVGTLDTTKALVDALDIRNDPKRDDKYLYKDKVGVEYSPQQWVTHILTDTSPADKKTLIKYFDDAKLKSRYFKRIKPGEGEQPVGYCGLPPELAKLWDPKKGEGWGAWGVKPKPSVPAGSPRKKSPAPRHRSSRLRSPSPDYRSPSPDYRASSPDSARYEERRSPSPDFPRRRDSLSLARDRLTSEFPRGGVDMKDTEWDRFPSHMGGLFSAAETKEAEKVREPRRTEYPVTPKIAPKRGKGRVRGFGKGRGMGRGKSEGGSKDDTKDSLPEWLKGDRRGTREGEGTTKDDTRDSFTEWFKGDRRGAREGEGTTKDDTRDSFAEWFKGDRRGAREGEGTTKDDTRDRFAEWFKGDRRGAREGEGTTKDDTRDRFAEWLKEDTRGSRRGRRAGGVRGAKKKAPVSGFVKDERGAWVGGVKGTGEREVVSSFRKDKRGAWVGGWDEGEDSERFGTGMYV